MANRKRIRPPISRLSVYGGRLYQGYVITQSGRWAAYTADGRPLGTFLNMQAAANAVAAAAFARPDREAAA